MKIAEKTIKLKNGLEILLKSPSTDYAPLVIDFMRQMYKESDFMAVTPSEAEEIGVESERIFLAERNASLNETVISAFYGGKIIGNCGISAQKRKKYAHRATFGISVLKDFWSIGVGSALTESAVDFAKQAGFAQVELTTVSTNVRAIALYKKFGFVQTGTIPRAQKLENGEYSDYIYMVKVLK